MRTTPKLPQNWLTAEQANAIANRYGPSVRRYTVSEMDAMVRGNHLPSRYRNVGGLILPVTNEGEPIRD